MGTQKIINRKRGPSKKDMVRLNPQQFMFVNALLADPTWNLSAAARTAGYAHPAQAGQRLMENKTVKAALDKAIYDRNQRVNGTSLTQDMVLGHLSNALFLDPIVCIKPLGDGKFEVQDLDQIPEAIRRCITKMKMYNKYNQDGDVVSSTFEVEFMSKDMMLNLAMKHTGLLSDDKTGQKGANISLEQLLPLLLDRMQNGPSNVVDAEFIASKVSLPAPSDPLNE